MMEGLVRLAENKNCQPIHLFGELEKIAHVNLDVKLFSIMTIDFARDEARRIYTSSPEVYPLSGTKPIPENNWADIVIRRKQLFVANDYPTLVKTFPDHEIIKSLGCEAIINVPIIMGGEIHGTLNILGPRGAYPPDSIKYAEELKVPGTFCFLFNEYVKNGSKDG